MTRPILQVRDLVVDYEAASSARGFFTRSTRHRALDHVSFELARGEVLAVVGPSGSGKSTLARAALRLTPVASGAVLYRSSDAADDAPALDVLRLDARALRAARAKLQIVFQDPAAALDPRQTAAEAVDEVVRVHARAPRGRERARTLELFADVSLAAELAARLPHELSGGQRQRLVLARALATEPSVLFLDEPTSSLDVSVQAQVLQLLMRLRKERALSYVFVTHDFALVRAVADRVLVLDLGRVVEEGSVEEVLATPRHAVTRRLLDAAS